MRAYYLKFALNKIKRFDWIYVVQDKVHGGFIITCSEFHRKCGISQ
jgi:hypothetical protein